MMDSDETYLLSGDPPRARSRSTEMSILHGVTDRDRRGAQVHAVDLHGGLAASGVAGEVVALAPGSHRDLLEIEALGPTRRSPRVFSGLRARARTHDVVIAHGSATLLACSIALLGTGVPFVYRQISDPIFWAGTATRRWRVAAMLRRAAAVVALADGVAGIVARHYRLDRSKVLVVPNAVPESIWETPDDDEPRAGDSSTSLQYSGCPPWQGECRDHRFEVS